MQVTEENFVDYLNALLELDKAYKELDFSVREMPIKDKRHHERIQSKLEFYATEIKRYLIDQLTQEVYDKIMDTRWDTNCCVVRDKCYSELKGHGYSFVVDGEYLHTINYEYAPGDAEDKYIDHIIQLLNLPYCASGYLD